MSFTEPDNADRASFARTGVEAYARCTRSGDSTVTVDDPADPDSRENAEEVIGDLLGDLRHLCQAWGIDFDEVSERGRGHFEYEVAEEAEMKKNRVNADG